MFLPGSVLLDINPESYHYSFPRTLDAYSSIEDVSIVEFKEIAGSAPLGPESVGAYQGRVVTGSSDGFIYEVLANDTVKPLVRVVKDVRSSCITPSAEDYLISKFDRHDCGRPLGLKFDSKGALFVVEPFHGVYRVDNIFSEPKVSLVFDIKRTAELGRPSVFLDDVGIEERNNSKHILYISDISSKFTLEYFNYVLLGSEKLGKILRYDTQSDTLTVIAKKLTFPNGVEVTPDKDAVLFTDTYSRTISKYHLKGSKKGTTETLIENLPGEVDNIRVSAKGNTFWVSNFSPRTMLRPNTLDYYYKKPLLRKLVTRVTYLVGEVLIQLGSLFNVEYIVEKGHSIKTLDMFVPHFIDKSGLIIELDSNGKVVSSILDTSGKLQIVTEVREVASKVPGQRVLYLGSFGYPNLRRLVYTAK